MLYLVGVGLSSIEDITLKGLRVVKACDHVYIDAYTSILSHGIEEIEKLIGRCVNKADRECVEQTNVLIDYAKQSDVAFLVVGDPLAATTHLDLLTRCLESNVPVKVIHNASILNAAGCCGLQLYEFGETVSIPFWNELGRPESFFDKIEHNYMRGLHTLCLLDIQEKSIENILRRRDVFEPPRYMVCQQAAEQLLQTASRRSEASKVPRVETAMHAIVTPPPILTPECLVIGLARVGSDNCVITLSTLYEMARPNDAVPTPISQLLNGPLHSLIIPGRLQPLEIEWLMARERYSGNHKGDDLPHILISFEGEPATPFDAFCSEEIKRRRKMIIDSMFSYHCKHAIKSVVRGSD
ncbi:unnamed protein product [Protopolystoma xenopodis]|uniref:diphthine methyl ester synthase n=1 Tax=Protopolystoma xenopodis TaxID=117903 RepID=A0A448WGF1_9PLAT|nr:unnamed protein product [Protopolystoma xenopodis]